MTTDDFVALAEALRVHNRTADGQTEFTPDHLLVLAEFCASQDHSFNRKGWIDYVTQEWSSVENENTQIAGAIAEGKSISRLNRHPGSPKGRQKQSSAHG